MRSKSSVMLAALAVLGAGAPRMLTAQSNGESLGAAASSLFTELEYRMIGPTRGGRVTAVAGHADQPSTFYMGATGGGVWKTTDYGRSWRNISDGYFQTGSIGAIRVADSDPNVVYVGTGSDGIRSNVITGRGVYKSTDAGKTWTFVGLRNVGQIGAVLIHPENPDIAFVAAIGDAFGPTPDRGVYRSKDGGASWDKVLYVSDSTGAVDLEFAPDDPSIVYASMWRVERKPWTIISGAREGGVYKSSDGGDSWTRLTNGLPDGLRGKSDLAVSPADPGRLYVLFEAPVGEGGLYRSDDRGASFQLVTTYAPLLDRPFYYLNVDADPTNADVVYVNTTGFFKSTDAGKSFQRRGTPHGDNHDMWINPHDPNIFIQSNDGGANVTLDGGVSWSTQFNQPTAELYQVDVDDQFPYWVYAGQQDNTTIAVPSLPPYPAPAGETSYWLEVGGCETGPAVPKPGNPDIVYANCKGRFGRYSKTTGQEQQYYVGAWNMYGHNPRDLKYRFQRVSPIEVSPHDPNVVYHGSQYLHKTTDEGRTWETISPDLTWFPPHGQVISGQPITRDITGEEFYSTLYAIEESPLEPGVIWVGANDGPVHVTRDGGASWTDVTPEGLAPGGRVQTIDPSPHRPGKAYVAVYRYLLNDWQPYIYRTNDYGEHWTRLTTGDNGIPADYPTHAIREDPDREGLLYAGTEFGLFVSFDDGATWQPFQQNLPITPVTDIKVYRNDLVLSTMGRSFWILDDVTPLHELNDRVIAANAHLFAPRVAYRLRHRGSGGGAEPQYPPPAATIHYYLAQPVAELTLDILDAAGAVVRSYSSESSRQAPQGAQQGMRGPPGGGSATPNLATSAGLHRFTWDLRYEGPWDANAARSGRGGPMAVPGAYQVRLTAGSWTASQPLQLEIDPRVAADGVTQADLQAQLAFNLEVRDVLSEARRADHRVTSLRAQIKERQVGLSGSLAARAKAADEKLAALKAEFETADGPYPQPMLLDQIQYLASMTSRADQDPGGEARIRLDELKIQLVEQTGRLERIVSEDLSWLVTDGPVWNGSPAIRRSGEAN